MLKTTKFALSSLFVLVTLGSHTMASTLYFPKTVGSCPTGKTCPVCPSPFNEFYCADVDSGPGDVCVGYKNSIHDSAISGDGCPSGAEYSKKAVRSFGASEVGCPKGVDAKSGRDTCK